MDKLSSKKTSCGKFSSLGGMLNFMKLGDFAYGVPDVVRSPVLNDTVRSIQSAYEVQENHNQTVLESSSPDGFRTPDSLESDSSTSSIDGASTTSGSFTLPPSEDQMLLRTLLRSVTTSNESITSACLDKLSCSSTNDFKNYMKNTSFQSRRSDSEQSISETASDLCNFMKKASFDDHEIAQVVHDLVFDKYEEPYNRLLNKLKKLHLTEEENKFRNVVDELESVFKKKNASRQTAQSNDNLGVSSRIETYSVDAKHFENVTPSRHIQAKMFEGVKPVYSSTDSELEVELKPIGIPHSGKLNTTFTKTTYSTPVYTEPVKEVTSDLNKNSSSSNVKLSYQKDRVQNSITDLQKYLSVPDVIQNSLPPPLFKVEAQVYAFNVEGRQQKQNESCSSNTTAEGEKLRLLEKRKTYHKAFDLHDDITTLEPIEEHGNIYLQSSASPLVRSSTNQSHLSDNVEYNEYSFLRAALGDELLAEVSSNEYIVPQTASVGTDDISELLSSTSSIAQARRRRCRNRKSTETISTCDKKSLSLCNTVLQRSMSQHKQSSTIFGSFASYETITNFSQSISENQHDKKLIKNKIFVHETIIDQAERALEYGKRKARRFIGSPAHLEAERTLLVSKIRRQTLINTLYTIQDTPSDTHGRITITNLRCTLNTIRNNHNIYEQYYVCILQHKTTVYSTKISAPNRLGWIDFGGCFIFDNVANTFNIKIQLHCIQLSQGPQHCFLLPLLKPTTKLPMIKLIGETYIGIMNRRNEKFPLLYRDGDRFREHKLTASIHTSIKWPETLRGFLTIGIEKQEHQPIWNRRWCVLEHGKLKYYNYPSDENYCKPVGVVDLDTCKCCNETYRRYLRQKTLTLFIENEYKIYYLSADTTEEYNLWRKNVEVVLKLIKDWNMF